MISKDSTVHFPVPPVKYHEPCELGDYDKTCRSIFVLLVAAAASQASLLLTPIGRVSLLAFATGSLVSDGSSPHYS